MKQTVPLVMIILLPLIFSSLCEGNVNVQPPEISISMNDEFINGNTSKKITVKNSNNNNINATWYLEHPDPPSLIRPNRTFMPDLSWIDVKPKNSLIPPNGAGEFFIYLNIPENIETRDEHWETWITFKGEEQQFGEGVFNFEYAIRVYIDTPKKPAISINITHSDNSDYNLYFVLVTAIALTFLMAGTWYYKKKK